MSLKEVLKGLVEIAKAHPKGRRYDEFGRFHPDPTPIAPPVGYQRSPTIAEQLRTMVRSEHIRMEAEAAGMDTFEEADDFDVGDDYDPRSPWEEQFYGEFDVPLTAQEPVPRDPEDRNPPTPPPVGQTSSTPVPEAPKAPPSGQEPPGGGS